MLHSYQYGPKDATPFVFLHGFLGSGAIFPQIFERFRPDISFNAVSPDLPYHGKSADIRPENEAEWVEVLDQWVQKTFDQPILLHGYSMGGRLALAYAAKYPDRIKGAFFESTRFGFRHQQTQLIHDRLEEDKKTASQIRNNFKNFLNEWQEKSLFQTPHINPFTAELNKEIQEKQKAEAMAQALMSFSTAKMRDVRKIIMDMDMPAAVLLGSEDHQYRNHAQELVIYFGDADFYIVEGAKHRVHVDQPDGWTRQVVEFFNQYP